MRVSRCSQFYWVYSQCRGALGWLYRRVSGSLVDCMCESASVRVCMGELVGALS